MTKREAIQYVRHHDDSEEHDEEDNEGAGIWSLCCASPDWRSPRYQ